MSKDGSVGSSIFTPVKNDFFKSFISAHLSITHGSLKKYLGWVNPNFLYFDLCAGNGQTYPDGTESSPTIFLTEASKYPEINFFIRLVEIDKISSQKLEQAIIPYITTGDNCSVLNMDNSDFLKMPTETMFSSTNQKDKYYGIMYLDPNGSNLPLHEMTNFLSENEFTYLDVLINRNCTAAKRINGYRPGSKETIYDIVDILPKRIWYIRKPETQHQFSLMYGTNFVWNPLRNLLEKWNFYDTKSYEGESLMNYLSNPKVHSLPTVNDKPGLVEASLASTINELPLGISILPSNSEILENQSCFDKENENFGGCLTLTSYDDKSPVYEINSNSGEKALNYYRGLVEQFYKNNYREAASKIIALDSMDSLPVWSDIEDQYKKDVKEKAYQLYDQMIPVRNIILELKKEFPSGEGITKYKVNSMLRDKKLKNPMRNVVLKTMDREEAEKLYLSNYGASLLDISRKFSVNRKTFSKYVAHLVLQYKYEVDKMVYLLHGQDFSVKFILQKLKKEFPFGAGISEGSIYDKIKKYEDACFVSCCCNEVILKDQKSSNDIVEEDGLDQDNTSLRRPIVEDSDSNSPTWKLTYSDSQIYNRINEIDKLKQRGRPWAEDKNPVLHKRSSEETAEKFGTNRGKVERVRYIRKYADPEVQKLVESGKITINDGYTKTISLKKEAGSMLENTEISSIEISDEQKIPDDIQIPDNSSSQSDSSQTVIFTGGFRTEVKSKLIDEIKVIFDKAWKDELSLRHEDIDKDYRKSFSLSKFE